jgi:hypothetical protein
LPVTSLNLPRARQIESPVLARVVVLTAACTALLAAYLVLDPARGWALALAALLAAVGTDGIVRSHPRWRTDTPLAATAHLFLPAIAVIAAGLFLRDRLDGYERLLVLIPVAVALGLTFQMEYVSVDASHPRYPLARVVLALATYLSAFAMFALLTPEGDEIAVVSIISGLVALLLAIELLREDSLVSGAGLATCLALGISIAELRWALHYVPLDDLVGGALLLIGFYVGSGFSHHLLERDLSWSKAIEYGLVAAVGAAAVLASRAIT